MTDITPEQMRALADFSDPSTSDEWQQHFGKMRAALRTAADQLEAVQANVDAYMQKVASRVIDVFENADDEATAEDVMPEVFAAIGLMQHHGVTTDTAHQEDRDD